MAHNVAFDQFLQRGIELKLERQKLLQELDDVQKQFKLKHEKLLQELEDGQNQFALKEGEVKQRITNVEHKQEASVASVSLMIKSLLTDV